MNFNELCAFSFWWIVPVIMMILCFFMMRRRGGAMMCGFGPRWNGRYPGKGADSAMDILDRRYASGDIDRAEYEEKKVSLTASFDWGKGEAPQPGGK